MQNRPPPIIIFGAMGGGGSEAINSFWPGGGDGGWLLIAGRRKGGGGRLLILSRHEGGVAGVSLKIIFCFFCFRASREMKPQNLKIFSALRAKQNLPSNSCLVSTLWYHLFL